MPILAITPAAASAAVQAAEARPLLQPGSVVEARVLQVMDGGQVRIAIANMVLDVLSEAQLTAGANLRLAVSANADGIRLAIQPQNGAAQGAAPVLSAQTGDVSGAGRTVAAGEAPRATNPAPATQASRSAAALMQAVANAATRQSGLSPLFANVSAALAQTPLPPQIQQAALALLALRVPLDANLDGAKLEKAVGQSGIFLEGKLASGTFASGPYANGQMAGGNLATSDLKAALSVLRQALAGALPDSPEKMTGAPGQATSDSGRAGLSTGRADMDPAYARAATQGAGQFVARDASQIQAQFDPDGNPAAGERPAQAGAQAASDAASHNPNAKNAAKAMTGDIIRITGAPGFETQASTPRAAGGQGATNPLLTLARELDAALGGAGDKPNPTMLMARAQAMPASQTSNGPPAPPLRDGPPVAQGMAFPSLSPDVAPDEALRQLLKDTDGALARQTLLQAASLPDAANAGLTRMDAAQARLHFEIPFITAQGTAIAQFVIEDDGGGNAVAAESEKAWRARFTLNTEPAGPVHVMVILAGQRTSVRMWAERIETAAQLRGQSEDLSASLARAELQPGDISIKQGAPPKRAKAAKAGHFLDRAT